MVMVAVVQGMETPPNKKGKSNITLINTKLQHPLPPLPEHLTVGIFQHGGVLRRRLHLCEQMAQKKRSTMSKR